MDTNDLYNAGCDVPESFKTICNLIRKQVITYDEAWSLIKDLIGKDENNTTPYHFPFNPFPDIKPYRGKGETCPYFDRDVNAAKNILRFGVAENTTGKGVSPDGSRGKTGGGTPSGGSGDGHVSCPEPSENPMTPVVGVRQDCMDKKHTRHIEGWNNGDFVFSSDNPNKSNYIEWMHQGSASTAVCSSSSYKLDGNLFSSSATDINSEWNKYCTHTSEFNNNETK